LLLHPNREAWYCDQFVCMSVCLCVCVSVCLSASIALARLDLSSLNILYSSHVSVPRGSVLLWGRCDMLCISGFMHDVMYGRSGPYDDAWLSALRYRGGVWCLWVHCCSLTLAYATTRQPFSLHINNCYNLWSANIGLMKGIKRIVI